MEGTVYDLCIVGAGMFGSAAARHASAIAGEKVCLVGPEEPKAEEMSTREIFAAHYDEGRITSTLEEDIPSGILTKNSISRYRELEELSGIHFYHPLGFLRIDKKGSSLSRKVLQTTNATNQPVVDLSYNDIFKRRFPYIKLRYDDHPLLEDFGGGHINPRNMIAAQKKIARSNGCLILDKIVDVVKPFLNGTHEVVTEDGTTIKSRRILLCTGAFTNFKDFPMPKLKMSLNKETAALLKISADETQRLSAMPPIVYCRQEDKVGAYILPPILYPNGNHYLKIGHVDFDICDCSNPITTLEEVKMWYLSNGDAHKIENLSKLLIEMLPGLKCEEISKMTCVTCHNPGGLPYIDRVSSTITVAAVGNGKGAQFSDEVGRIAALLSLTGKWDSEISKDDFKVMCEE